MKPALITYFLNWTWIRVLYLVIGLSMLIPSIKHVDILGIVFGAYFSIMALARIGCAGGQCKY